MTIALPARAKLNLDLEVVSRREDGFHDIISTFQSIELHDLLEVAHAENTSLTATGFDIDTGEENSVLRAHGALETATRRNLPTRFHLDKRIPPGSGLGGASSDAATALRGLVHLYNITTDLTSIAELLGADVPFFLRGGTAIAEGRGDRLTPIPTRDEWFAIAWPSIELRTPDVYRAWDETPGGPPNHLAAAAMRIEPRLEAFANTLNRVKNGWQMTGSGSAFFTRCKTAQEASETTKRLECWTAVTRSVGAWA